jgi:hypothetical protein
MTIAADSPPVRPSQLFLPFRELESQVSPIAAARLECIRDWLQKQFPDFVLQQRWFPSGSAQITLYRVPDGTLYRLTVLERFFELDSRPEDIECSLEAHGLREKLPASVLTPIVLSPEGIEVPIAQSPVQDIPQGTRRGLGWLLFGRLMQAAGLSLGEGWRRGPT